MKLPITLLALFCSSALLCSAAWAQGNTSRTYTGINGPQGGKRPDTSYGTLPVPDNFVVNVYGQRNEFAFEVISQGGEKNRPRPELGTSSKWRQTDSLPN